MASVGFKGGEKLNKILAYIAEKAGKGGLLKVGFLEGATYPDGTNVAQVAYWNEYGTVTSPPRPFFRQMIASKSPKWGAALGKSLISSDYDGEKALKLMGHGISDQLVTSIVQFSTPENAASTIAAKGFNDPLIDTGLMQRTVDFEVDDE